jgi:hypothetical protein
MDFTNTINAIKQKAFIDELNKIAEDDSDFSAIKDMNGVEDMTRSQILQNLHL